MTWKNFYNFRFNEKVWNISDALRIENCCKIQTIFIDIYYRSHDLFSIQYLCICSNFRSNLRQLLKNIWNLIILLIKSVSLPIIQWNFLWSQTSKKSFAYRRITLSNYFPRGVNKKTRRDADALREKPLKLRFWSSLGYANSAASHALCTAETSMKPMYSQIMNRNVELSHFLLSRGAAEHSSPLWGIMHLTLRLTNKRHLLSSSYHFSSSKS